MSVTRAEYSSELHFGFDSSVQIKVEEKAVLVVSDGAYE